MIYSDLSLHIHLAAGHGPNGVVHMLPDGSLLAMDSSSRIVCEPSDLDETDYRVDGVDPVPLPPRGVSVPKAFMQKVLGGIASNPRRRIHKSAVLTGTSPKIALTTSDGIRDTALATPASRVPLPDYAAEMRKMSRPTASITVNLKMLRSLLQAVEKMCGGKDGQPVLIELTDEPDTPLRVRTKSFVSRQIIHGVLLPVRAKNWLPRSAWERRLLGTGPKKKKPPVRRKRL